MCIITYLIPFNWAINVGIGISDVTGPAAEIGMVRNNYIFCYYLLGYHHKYESTGKSLDRWYLLQD